MYLTMKLKNLNRQTITDYLYQFFKFGIVGVSNTLVALTVYYVLIYLRINYIIANSLAFVISILNAYYWNNRYVFVRGRNKSSMGIMSKVFIAYSMSFILNTGLLIVMIGHLGISSYIAPIVNLFITTPINFLLNKYWAFNESIIASNEKQITKIKKPM